MLNLTGFLYSYSDQTFQDLTCLQSDPGATPPCTGYSLVNRNIGRSRIAGLEAEGRFVLGRATAVDLHLTWLDARITRGRVADARAQDFSAGGIAPLIDLAGHRLPLASKFNLAARVQQSMAWGDGRLTWQGLLNYRSAYHLTQFNEAPVRRVDGTLQTALAAGFPDRQPGVATLNLSLGYAVSAWGVEAFVYNLTDAQASQKALVGANLHVRYLNDPRRFGLRARMDFRAL
jgi:iron complex outermembrane receptor protein